MRLGIIIYSTDPEVVWNAFRLGVFSLDKGSEVKAFLMAKGVEAESLDTDQFKVTEIMQGFADKGGRILACGTCLKLRGAEGTELCPSSTMKDLHDLIEGCDRIVTF